MPRALEYRDCAEETGTREVRSVGCTYRIRVHAPRRGRPRQAGVTECADLLFHIRAPRAQQPFRTSWGRRRGRGGGGGRGGRGGGWRPRGPMSEGSRDEPRNLERCPRTLYRCHRCRRRRCYHCHPWQSHLLFPFYHVLAFIRGLHRFKVDSFIRIESRGHREFSLSLSLSLSLSFSFCLSILSLYTFGFVNRR